MTPIAWRPRKRHRITPPPTIPDDLLVSEILARLPAAFLLRIRSWRAAVKDPAFIRRHLELSRARPPAILAFSLPVDDDDPGEEEEVTATSPAPVVTIRAAHCDGLDRRRPRVDGRHGPLGEGRGRARGVTEHAVELERRPWRRR
ncbi:unnamed protein product [Urochloa humidicola]